MSIKDSAVWGRNGGLGIGIIKLLFLVFLIHSPSHAIGLGDLNVLSGKFMPLHATVLVQDYPPEDIDQLQVSLSSAEFYQRVGLPRPVEITQLQFSSKLVAGLPVIEITSQDIFQIARCMLALDVKWPQGELALMYQLRVPQPTAQELALFQQQYVDAHANQRGAQATLKTSDIEQNYKLVSVPEGMTLWSIAAKHLPTQDVSVNQVMLALISSNPDSFEFDNVNSLKAKTRLKIPHQMSFEFSREQAKTMVQRQHQEWEQLLSDEIKTHSLSTHNASELNLNEQQKQAPLAKASDAAAPRDNAESTKNTIQSEYNDGIRAVDTVEEIELSAQPAGSDQLVQPAEVEPLPDWQNLPQIQSDDALSSNMIQTLDEVEQIESESSMPTPEISNTYPFGPMPAFFTTALNNTKQLAGRLLRTESGQRFSAYWQQHQLLIMLILLICLLLFISQRVGHNRSRHAHIHTDPPITDLMTARESIIHQINQSRAASMQLENGFGPPQVNQGDTLSAADESQSDQRGILEEVNIYLSYGLFLEAADLLTKALEKNPEHVGYLLKLAETYAQTERTEDFLLCAEKLAKLVKHDSLAWRKLTTYAHRIVPEHMMFTTPDSDPEDDLVEFSSTEFELENLIQAKDLTQQHESTAINDKREGEFDSEDNATKLDLAKVYIEMGDPEAAREVLLDVLTDCTPEQREEANKLCLIIN